MTYRGVLNIKITLTPSIDVTTEFILGLSKTIFEWFGIYRVVENTISVTFILLISCVINENPQFETRDFKVLWDIKINLSDRKIGAQVTK